MQYFSFRHFKTLFGFFQVVPSKIHLEATGHQLGKVLNYKDLILDIEVQEAVLKELSKHGKNTDKNIFDDFY